MRFALEYLLEGLVCVLLSLSIHYSAGELALAIFLALGILAALVLFCYRCTQRTLKKSNYESAKGDKQDLISQVCCWRTRSLRRRGALCRGSRQKAFLQLVRNSVVRARGSWTSWATPS